MTRVIDQLVLVLNRNWQPVAFLRVSVAIASVVRGMAWVVEPETYRLLEWDDWVHLEPEGARMVKTSSGGVPAPDVIVLRQYRTRPRRGVAFTRRNLYRRDGYSCQYCGVQPGVGELTIDHVQPRSRAGATSWENCVVACGPCNRAKADRTPAEAGMQLRCRPARPTWREGLRVDSGEVRPTWVDFVKGDAVVEVG